MTRTEFFSGCSRPRNRELIRVFKDLRLVEQLGTGVRKVLKKYPKEVFEFMDNSLKITIPISGDNIMPLRNPYEIIIEHIKEHGSIDRATTELILELGKTQANTILKDMVEDGLLSVDKDGRKNVYAVRKKELAFQG